MNYKAMSAVFGYAVLLAVANLIMGTSTSDKALTLGLIMVLAAFIPKEKKFKIEQRFSAKLDESKN